MIFLVKLCFTHSFFFDFQVSLVTATTTLYICPGFFAKTYFEAVVNEATAMSVRCFFSATCET